MIGLVANRLTAILAERKARERHFPGLGEPAWIMLVDLALAKLERRHVSVTSACIASYAAATTALRHIDILLALGLIERLPDPEDARRWWLVVTDHAAATLDAMFGTSEQRPAA